MALITFFIHATVLLGRTPYYNQPDPQELSIYSTYSPIIDQSLNVWVYSFPLWLLVLPLCLFLTRRDKEARFPYLQIAVCGQIITILAFLSGLMGWYVD